MATDQQPEHLETQHIEEKINPEESRIFVMCAGALMVAEITFGLLNTFHVIHM